MEPQFMQWALSLFTAITGYALCYLLLYLILKMFFSPIVAKWLAHGLLVIYALGFIFATLMTQVTPLVKTHQLMFALYGMVITNNVLIIPFYYWYDKRQSGITGATRIPESVLHIFAFLGGALSAIVSQRVFHHKTQKKKFQWITAVAMVSTLCIFYAFYMFCL